MISIVWLRRDLRLYDNPALCAAAEQGRVLPVYIHAPDEDVPWAPGGAACWWLHHSLAALDRNLRRRHSRLIIRRGPGLEALQRLIEETGARTVYWNRLYEPAAIERDTRIKAALHEQGVTVRSHNGALLWEPWTVRTGSGDPYKVFTPFWKACVQHPPPAPLDVPRLLSSPSCWPDSLPLEALGLLPRIRWHDHMEALWQPGEAGAHQRLDGFRDEALADYADGRDRPDRDGASRLSPYLHWGEITPRQIWRAVTEACGGDPLEQFSTEAYLRELGWREFAHHVLYHFPHTAERSMDTRFEDYPWERDETALRAWQRGRTGIPLVDAGMRQLWRGGWMHNRVRMVVASFLTKNLRIHWLEGARWFWEALVDADLASNSLGWQWTAGCGVDAAPYFRVFNPIRQGERHDPEAEYIARWVPELASLPARWRHQPWAAPEDELRRAGIALGATYPRPLVDLRRSRQQALEGYERIRKRPA